MNPLRMAANALGSDEPYTTMADEVWARLDERERQMIAVATRPLVEGMIEQYRQNLVLFDRLHPEPAPVFDQSASFARAMGWTEGDDATP